MSVSSVFELPAQPTTGSAVWVPLGGDGVTAPLGYYDVVTTIVGDVSGGTAQLRVDFDPRYTNLCAWANVKIIADTAAGDFAIHLNPNATTAGLTIVGTMPGVAEAVFSTNSAYLWFPPPLFHAGEGTLIAFWANVDATETYSLSAQIFVYDRDVRNRMNMTWLHQLIPSTTAPTSS